MGPEQLTSSYSPVHPEIYICSQYFNSLFPFLFFTSSLFTHELLHFTRGVLHFYRQNLHAVFRSGSETVLFTKDLFLAPIISFFLEDITLTIRLSRSVMQRTSLITPAVASKKSQFEILNFQSRFCGFALKGQNRSKLYIFHIFKFIIYIYSK